ncbi:RagB/SusD family nutrient uptake outer membrane protein [Niabella ginsengisoli]|uniref:RagB/SusD family nutrient uptake outer membrane protein n=1 Tax=Niabella ginsengisoli TaxID=522298 RepID=A0ABS9SDL7_9BACT|nr:RagB/SusD family nutrient uptake outer membrane protein [Niabella ginsengisoli]MCH5596446.1 RagB/SusD family nutrient uptake outer membrane protein [Niabella ginsengisoli]
MKQLKIFSLVALTILCLSLGSCEKFLEEKPESFLNADNFFQTEAQALSAVNACYLRLYNIYRGDLMMATEYTSDLSYLTNGGVDQSFGMSPSNPGVSDGIWTSAYNGIMVCNATIAGIQNSASLPEEKKPALIGEAAIMRALYYYILTSVFGDVPYYTSDASASFDALMEVAKMGRMPAAATRDSVIKDLQKWAPAMPQTKSSSIPDNRVGAPLAYMLIGKMALWNKEWDVCIDAMQKLKDIYGALSQYSLTDTWFRNKNKAESIFEVQYSGVIKISNVATQMTPARASGAVYDGVTIPELGTTTTTFTAAIPTAYLMSLYEDSDPRKNTTLAYTHNGVWFNRPKSNNYTGKPWPGPKFWCPSMSLQQDNNNQKVFRFADALLMLAEAANEKDDPATALSAINEVKARANASFVLTSYPGKDAFREELKKERARELYGEYGRKWDLVRWGDFYTRVSATSATEVDDIQTNLRPYHEYYPIPQSEVERSGGVLTNDAYNQ